MLKVDDENFVDRLMNFVTWNYGDVIDEMGEKYPYTALPDREEHLVQASLWATCKVTNPETGTTILNEFANRFVHEDKLKSNILRLEEMEYDTFAVLECNDTLITAASKTGRGIICLDMDERIARNMAPGMEFEGLVYPWGNDNIYRMMGRVDIIQTVFDPNAELAAISSKSGHASTGVSLLGLLQDCSTVSLECTCDAIGIDPSGMGHARLAQEISQTLTTDRVRRILDNLTPAARDCLRYVACNGGFARCSDLHEQFGDGFDDMLDELECICLVMRVSFHQSSTTYDAVYMAPDLLAAMYRLGCLGLKQWEP